MSRNSRLRCEVIGDLLIKDYPTVKKSSFYEQCPANHYKIASVVDKGNDHHWYRMNEDSHQPDKAYWSHKSGEQDVTNRDARGQPIFNPKQAARDYTDRPDSNLNYEDFCGFYCVPRGLQGPGVSKTVEKEMAEQE